MDVVLPEGSLHLEQGCQYDGSFQKSDLTDDQGEYQCLQYGCLTFRFDMRLRSTRNEQFVICRNGPVAYCTVTSPSLPYRYLYASATVAAQEALLALQRPGALTDVHLQWQALVRDRCSVDRVEVSLVRDLRLLERTGHDLTLDLCFTSESEPVYAEIGAIAFNSNIPEKSVLKSKLAFARFRLFLGGWRRQAGVIPSSWCP